MEILDDQQLETNTAEQFSNLIFIKKMRFFSIVTLIHSIALSVISILLIIYCFVVKSIHVNEAILLVYAGSFAFLGAFLLFRTYHFINKYIHKSNNIIALNKGMNHFLLFWIVLIFGFLFLILLFLGIG